ncbi:MAG: tetratricopeptide repeat protein, partial [Planctomycetes bacterium]|nr:tetratricopeptide repeat protein [Planctomycetota bacterium]
GLAALEAGQPSQALERFRAALTLAPDAAALRQNAARCELTLGDAELRARRLDEARAHYRAAGSLLPDDPTPRVREALACLASQQPAEAEALLRPVADRAPTAAVLEVLGRAQLARGDAASALRSLERARERCSADSPQAQRLDAQLTQARREALAARDVGAVDLSATHFEVRYSGVGAAAGSGLGRILEDAYERVGQLLGRYPNRQVPVVVYPAADGLTEASGAHRWIGGLYDGRIRVTADALSAPGEARRLLAHEYTHALLHSVGGSKVPAWLQEGLAQLAEGSSLPAPPRRGQAPTLAQLSQSFAQAGAAEAARRYAAAAHFVRHLSARGGMPLLLEVVERIGRGEAPADAVEHVYGVSLERLYQGWAETLR